MHITMLLYFYRKHGIMFSDKIRIILNHMHKQLELQRLHQLV